MNRLSLPGLAFEAGGLGPARPALGQLEAYLRSLVAAGYPPSVSLGIVDSSSLLLEAYGGNACAIGQPVATTRHTIYDLASLTKVVCTVSLVMLARQRELLALDDPVAKWLPRFPGPATTLMHLLTHTSGLVEHRPFYATAQGKPAVEAAVYQEAAGARPGTEVRYSDLNFMLLGWVLESCSGRALDDAFATEMAVPLSLGHSGFRPSPGLRPLTAATELDGDQRLTPGLIWGEVHDGNAWALGGVAGHAGLFAPLEDMCRFSQALLAGADGPFWPDSLADLGRRQAATGDDVRGIGWRLGPPGNWGRWPAGTMWHTGFTGTSLLVAPAMDVAVVLLTNAVHPHRHLERQAQVRSEVHRLIAEALG